MSKQYCQQKASQTDLKKSRSLIYSYISHDELVLVNNVLKEYDDMKAKIKTVNILGVHQRFQFIWKM